MLRPLRAFAPALLLALPALLAAPVAHAQLAVARGTVGAGGTTASGGAFGLAATVGQPGVGAAAGGAFEARVGFWPGAGAGGGPALLTLAAAAWLQGPYNAGAANMNAALSPVLPQTDPYTGTASVASPTFFTSDPNGLQVVDWVLVRLASGDPATSLTLAAERPGLLLRSGRIVGTDGATDLSFSGVSAGSYYVVVRHRNHLAVVSSAAVAFPASLGAWDFRTAATQAYGANAMQGVAPGAFALVAGDGNASGDVSAADRNSVWRVQNGLAGYRTGDYNLSGDVSAVDRNTFWRPNNGRAAQVPPF